MLKSVFLFVIVAVSAAAMYMLLVFLKEGWSADTTTVFVAVILLLVALLLGWWRLWAGAGASSSMYPVGVTVLFLPLAFYAFFGTIEMFYQARAYVFAKNARIVGYRSAALYWPGFAQPVGARIEIDLKVPFAMGGSFLEPKIILANTRPDPVDIAPGTYYMRRCAAADAADVCMQVPRRPYSAFAPPTEGKTMHLAYELVPSNVTYLKSSNHLCVSGPGTGRGDGDGEVRALWVYGSDGSVTIDLGPALTQEILRDHAVDWAGMLRGKARAVVNGETLTRAGYQSCPPEKVVPQSACYCRVSTP